MALEEGLNVDQAIWLQTYLGIASALGAFLFGIVSLSKSQQCMISRQYLLQASIFGIGMYPADHQTRTYLDTYLTKYLAPLSLLFLIVKKSLNSRKHS